MSGSAGGCYFWSAPRFTWPRWQEGNRRKKRKGRRAAWPGFGGEEDQLSFGRGQWGTPQPLWSLGRSPSSPTALLSIDKTHHSNGAGQPRHHTLPWYPGGIAPSKPSGPERPESFWGAGLASQLPAPSCAGSSQGHLQRQKKVQGSSGRDGQTLPNASTTPSPACRSACASGPSRWAKKGWGGS